MQLKVGSFNVFWFVVLSHWPAFINIWFKWFEFIFNNLWIQIKILNILLPLARLTHLFNDMRVQMLLTDQPLVRLSYLGGALACTCRWPMVCLLCWPSVSRYLVMLISLYKDLCWLTVLRYLVTMIHLREKSMEKNQIQIDLSGPSLNGKGWPVGKDGIYEFTT